MTKEWALREFKARCKECKEACMPTKEECDECIFPIAMECIEKRKKEICANCRHFKEVRQLIEKQWHTFHICDFLMDCEKGYGIVVVPNDMCECFVKEVEND